MATEYAKGPGETLNFPIDWSDWLETADTISAAEWTVPSGITEVSDSNTDTATEIILSGGTDGESYQLSNTITTANALIGVREIVINVGVPSGGSPVSLEEAKSQLCLDGLPEANSKIQGLIDAATFLVENRQQRTLLSRTRIQVLDDFPLPGARTSTEPKRRSAIRVDFPPLVSVTSISYQDTADVTQTLDASKYVVATKSPVGTITPASGETWPQTFDEPEAVTITYVAGYGDAGDVPELTKLAIKELVVHWFEHPSEYITGTIVSKIPDSANMMIEFNRIRG